jgi:hypothetical protein
LYFLNGIPHLVMKKEQIHRILTKNNVLFYVFGYPFGNVYFRWVDAVELGLGPIQTVDNNKVQEELIWTKQKF